MRIHLTSPSSHSTHAIAADSSKQKYQVWNFGGAPAAVSSFFSLPSKRTIAIVLTIISIGGAFFAGQAKLYVAAAAFAIQGALSLYEIFAQDNSSEDLDRINKDTEMLRATKTKLEATEKKLENSISDYKKLEAKLQTDTKDLNARVKDYKKENKDLEKTESKLEEDCNKLKKTVAEYTTKEKELRADVATLKKALKEQEEAVNDFIKKTTEHSKQVGIETNLIGEMHKENATLNEKLNYFYGLYSTNLKKFAANLQVQIDKMKAEIQANKKGSDQEDGEVAKLNTALEKQAGLQRDLDAKEARLREMAEQEKKAQAQFLGIKENIEKDEARHRELINAMVSTQASHEKEKESLGILEQSVKAAEKVLADTLTKSEAAAAMLEKKLTALEDIKAKTPKKPKRDPLTGHSPAPSTASHSPA